MSNQSGNNNNTTSNDSNNTYEGMELFEEDIKKAELAEISNKRARDDDDSEGPESKRQREDDYNESDYMSSENSSETSDSDSVSDNGEVSETDRINTKYSKRFDAIQDYKEKNELLSDKSIENVMNKLDKDEDLSAQELETLGRAFRLMDKTIPNDQDSLERMQLYEAFSGIVPCEISENNERIEHHEKKISEYLARLEELNKEKNEMSSDNESNHDSDSNDGSNHDNNSNNNSNENSDSNNLSNSNNPSNSSGPNDDDGFDDFPPSFDFDDF